MMWKPVALLLGCTMAAVGVAMPGASAQETDGTRIVIAGDSTASPYPVERQPQAGWGQALQYFLGDIAVENRAVSGRSTRSYVDEGKWAALLEALQPGDIVLISFGHNDQRDDAPERYAEANTDYRAYLKQFVADVRARDARPVIVSSAARRLWEGPAMVETHGLYRWNAQKAAEKTGAAYIDLATLSLAYFETIGREETKEDFLWLTPEDRNERHPDGVEDNTHFTALGACGVAMVVTLALAEEGIISVETPSADVPADALRPQAVTDCAGAFSWAQPG
ncbi:rhamnogalacturonan acetylesterase [Parvularcula flava]|uniref:Rhamnogalacturonan acetylesterase n=1 Tax=Aquisalinus luteolus TaxID=1566827 RepID=A0A8J3EPS9_9PROT|nr:rhamnogalacturonan acetylesterase [Aquisalinus luteolus]NHK26363.1 rhamnogalacturonan acetylesterase [Aquisalinus luteolus]GGH92106.1 hypothetical protein GCM10011355_00820 [Aquisalinus luteolus]